jgi:hypothetical protein
MGITQQPGEVAFAGSDATDQTDHRDSSRSICHAEAGESEGREAVNCKGFEDRTVSRPIAVGSSMMQTRFAFRKCKTQKPRIYAGSSTWSVVERTRCLTRGR